jgi:hypothetical protein
MVLIGVAVAAADQDEPGPSARSSRLSGTQPSGKGPGAGSSSGPCGAASAQTIAAVYVHVAKRIYSGETAGHEVSIDLAHIAGSQQLVSAVASSNQVAAYAAVHTIVYTPHWHIVRLRVVKNGRVLADVGGPYIIAPLTGTLRQNGRKVGSFVTAVQDDLGYVKLVTRFIGVPIDLYGTPRPPASLVMGTLAPAPPPADGTIVKVGGARYLARTLAANAFPSGKLKVALFIPIPSRASARQSCVAIRNAAWGSVVKHVAARFSPLTSHYDDMAGTLQGSTGGLTFVRVGSRQIAGLSAGPARLPTHGTVSYRGRRWQVFSWSPHPPARIYFLAPTA